MENEIRKKRRTHEQAAAHKRYPRMRWLFGDGEWLCLSQCSQPWNYRLFHEQLDANTCAKESCGPNCNGVSGHKVWRVIPTEELKGARRDAHEDQTERRTPVLTLVRC